MLAAFTYILVYCHCIVMSSKAGAVGSIKPPRSKRKLPDSFASAKRERAALTATPPKNASLRDVIHVRTPRPRL